VVAAALLKHFFSYAIREEWLEHNPVSKIKMEKENNSRDRVLTPQEFDLLQATPPLPFRLLTLRPILVG
jgi:site-specific recombinase XerD